MENTEYRRVTLLLRRPLTVSHPRLEQRVIDFGELARYRELFGVDDVSCCLGTTIGKTRTREAFKQVDLHYPVEIARLSKEAGVKKFLIITALGADPKSGLFYNRVKGEVEERIRDLCLDSLHIFRPSVLIGDRKERRVGERILVGLFKAITPVLIGSLRKYRPTRARDVAAAMVSVAQQPTTGVHVYESDLITDLSAAGS